MKIRLTRNTFAGGQSHSSGDELEVKDAVGKQLLLLGKAIEIKDTPQFDRVVDVDPIPAVVALDTTQATIVATDLGAPAKVIKRKKGL
jgi:hypothetical protein